ncbi:MAG TPA: hypothetical protein VM284_06170 [Candidatus Limnocylindria bacterium]|nr:hypothetical protein [Candidatus Limnocylindria bacterium]
MRFHRLTTGGLLSLGVAALMAASTLTVYADTLISSTGHTGPNHLRDSMSHPGARCWYEEGGGSGEEVLTSMRVKAPVVFARDTTPARDRQKIRFKAIVQRRDGAGAWVFDAARSTTAFAWDDTMASLGNLNVAVFSHFGSKFRARVEITYYSMSGGSWAQTGQVLRAVDWYRHIFYSADYGNDVRTVADYCRDYEINT